MKINEQFLTQFNQLAAQQSYVFDECDLQVMLGTELNQTFYRAFAQLKRLGLIDRFCRGIYIAKGFKLIDVNMVIDNNSYLSFEYVLAKNGLVGTYSDLNLRSVICEGRTRSYSYQDYTLEQYKLSENLFFGFENIDGYNVATSEKAYLDCLYFYTKGTRFAFDIFSDVDLSLLDYTKIEEYLRHYKNPKFVNFVKGTFSDD
jgi:predicted transcriptional regulator of viral defense system